ncbi:glucose/arabinose dehydrogenase [Micromonospora pisi]|uniref:Glucose/arabinose dehydrogenase n=1 Tax=Micromonospora pisi TaxID=589240 RepID=A0A495JD44_9ACTN|nr:ThuA domain-containing protein [Micromonospora pisi]RKR86272.1 glucose/arabinose dehydrogenase [Micromonospora pisi]
MFRSHHRSPHPPTPRRLVRTLAGLTAAVTATVTALGAVAPPAVAAPSQAAPAAQAKSPAQAPERTGNSRNAPAAQDAQAAAAYAVLVFSKTAGFRHDSIPAGITAIQQLGAANDFTVDATEDATAFTDANLSRYRAVIWLSTTGDVLDPTQQAAFERYIRAGGGYVGIHAAADTEYDWSWYGNLVGAYFASHPANQQATVKVEDPGHPSTATLPARWSRFDEWYNFRTNPRGSAHVLASLDESTYTPGSGAMGADHPTAWCKTYDGGRSWYTGGGHTNESYADAQFRAHLLGGIQTAAGVVAADCGASQTSSFEKVTLDSSTNNPMELDIAPDGRVFYLERDGRLRIIKPDTQTTVTAATLNVFTGNEDGLLGLTLDPNFATNRWVYLYYSPNGGAARNLLSRFTMNGDTLDLASERILLQVDTQRNTCCHSGGTMTFDSAGNLYLATGDNTNPFESGGYSPLDERAGRQDFDAQRSSGNTNDLRGKVIRIRPEANGTYTVPAGNLFAPGTAQTRPEIYAMGFRNPFRIGVDPETNALYVADYGPDAGQANADRGPGNTVEWNIVGQAGNYGWPYCVGRNVAYRDYTFPNGPSGPAFNCAAPVNNSPNNTGLTNLPPVVPATVDYDYDANPLFPELGGGGAPMAGPVYRYDPGLASARKWPAYYDGKAIFGEWNQSKMYTMQVSADGRSLVDINPLLTGMSTVRPMDFDFGPDGALYLIEWGSGFGGNNDDSGVYRIDYRAVDPAPIAAATGQPVSGRAPLTVQFSSAGSRDPEGQPITYAWRFGDGGTSTQANPSHTYTGNGNFTAQLTVTDPGGRSAVANVPVTVGNTAPVVTLSPPPNGGFFDWGAQVNYTVNVTDPDGGTIDCSRVVLQYLLGHDEHAHPLQQKTGCSGSIQTSLDSGHGGDANIFAVLEATYTDLGGPGGAAPLTGRSLVQLQPKRKQAEYFTTTGRVAGAPTGGTPGVQRETTSDPQGGFQNIAFVENGDWWSYSPTNLTGIQSLRLRAASGSSGGTVEVRSGSATGTLLGSVTVPGTGGWQTYTDLTVPLAASTSTGALYFVAKAAAGTPAGTALVNVNWVDFIGPGVGGNTPPQVTASATPTSGSAPLLVTFTGNATDAEGDNPLSYAWDFGDGGTANTANATHTYASAGTFTATLTVTDSRGARGTATVVVTATGGPTPTGSSNVHLFYYPWYGSPTGPNGGWRHWQQGGRTPPNDVGADFYPTLGAYDSGDPAVLTQHMNWVKQSGANVLVYSWWGQGSYEDNLVNTVMNAAAQQGIKIAWHLEPYAGRTAASTVADINYINTRYGNHPAFYRAADQGNRPAFYVFESLLIPDWSALAQVNANNIILAQTTDTSKIANFSGMYTYDAIAAATAPGWANASAYAKANGLIWAPSIGPGYIDDRAVPGNTTPTLARNNGATYDQVWNNALGTATGGLPTWVSITSFNEWHEGSTLEPARSTPPAGFNYQTFSGAYGRTGASAETAYLDRTAYWAAEFERRRAGTGGGLVAQPTSLSFGAQNVNTSSAAQAVTIRNTGTAAVALTGVVTGGDFSQTNTCGSSLAAGATCTVNVTFRPTAAGARSGSLTVTPATGSVLTVPLAGTGVTPSSNLAAGRPVTATSTNQGYGPGNTVDGNVSSYWESANNAFPQSLTVDLGTSATVNRAVLKLPANWETRNQTLSVLGSTDGTTYTTVLGAASYTFNPASANTVTLNLPAGARRYLRLTFTGNSGWPAAQLAEFEVYAGSGTGGPALSLSPGSLSFGSRTVGSPSPASAVTVTNAGTAAANLTGVSVTGDFAQSHNCGSSLAAGATCTVNVTFTPTASGARTGTLSVVSNAPGSPHTVALSGTGTSTNTNLAAGRPITATSTNQSYGPGNAVDGNASSYWESANNAFPQSLTVDLGTATTVSRLVLKLPPQADWQTRTQTLSVLGSTNGSTYATVVGSAGYSFNPATGNTVTITFQGTSQRYLRLTFTGNTGWPAGQLSEFEAYAS